MFHNNPAEHIASRKRTFGPYGSMNFAGIGWPEGASVHIHSERYLRPGPIKVGHEQDWRRGDRDDIRTRKRFSATITIKEDLLNAVLRCMKAMHGGMSERSAEVRAFDAAAKAFRDDIRCQLEQCEVETKTDKETVEAAPKMSRHQAPWNQPAPEPRGELIRQPISYGIDVPDSYPQYEYVCSICGSDDCAHL